MKPGRELDFKIAELLGWESLAWITLTHASEKQLVGVRPNEIPSLYTGFKPKHTVPFFSTEIAAAWDVVQKLNKTHWVKVSNAIASPWEAEITSKRDTSGSKLVGYADTASHAICLVSLEAAGVEL